MNISRKSNIKEIGELRDVRVGIRLELSRSKNEMRGIKFPEWMQAAERQMKRTVGETVSRSARREHRKRNN